MPPPGFEGVIFDVVVELAIHKYVQVACEQCLKPVELGQRAETLGEQGIAQADHSAARLSSGRNGSHPPKDIEPVRPRPESRSCSSRGCYATTTFWRGASGQRFVSGTCADRLGAAVTADLRQGDSAR
jgi:hypothetical protein